MRADTYADCCERIGDTVRHIHLRLDEKLDIATLAGIASFSPFHFQRVFRRIAGETAMDSVRRLRLERAAHRAQSTGDNLTAIALDSGFDSLEAFTRAFKCGFGMSPSRFREVKAGAYWIGSPSGLHFSPLGSPDFRPLRPKGLGVSFEVEYVETIDLAAKPHQGPLQFIANTWLEFAEAVKARGVDVATRPMIAYSDSLAPPIDLENLQARVAVLREDLDDRTGFAETNIGGGDHLVARHIGSGHLLTDFWFRAWAECLPQSGREVRSAACFQIHPNGLFTDDPGAFVTDIYIPVHLERRGSEV